MKGRETVDIDTLGWKENGSEHVTLMSSYEAIFA